MPELDGEFRASDGAILCEIQNGDCCLDSGLGPAATCRFNLVQCR